MGLVSRQQMGADVDFYALWLEDADDTSERDEPEDGAQFVAACGQRVYLQSGGHTHTPALSVEVWDDQAPADGGVGEAQDEAGMDVQSGQIRVWTYIGPCEDAIERSIHAATSMSNSHCSRVSWYESPIGSRQKK
ncbi:hypothetical protein [Streptomyces sp. NPDC058297]|uniref:hypothetical protein n=1 Tax=Streptomyces sp. NPDC058297 TaxID=3346433 RepID=UPI0036E644BF